MKTDLYSSGYVRALDFDYRYVILGHNNMKGIYLCTSDILLKGKYG